MADLDGNVLAGPLSELLAPGAELDGGRCGSCGTATVIAEVAVAATDTGYLATCRACGAVLFSLVTRHGSTRLHLEALEGLSVSR